MNEKLLFIAVLCFGIFFSLTVNATMTDGNYVMIAYSTTGSGETMTDTNYSITLANAGETATSQTIKDANRYSAGIGFLGNPFVFVLATVVIPEELVETATKTIFAILPKEGNSMIGIILLAMIAGFVLFFVFTKKRLPTKEKAIDDNEEEYIDEEENEEGEGEESGAV